MNVQIIGIGIIVSLLYTEIIGLACGGIISAGYLVQFLNQPIRLVVTTASAMATYGIVSLLSSCIILFGRRRFAACVIIGYLFGWLAELLIVHTISDHIETRIIGYVIAGLIANDMIRQGMWQTIVSITSVTIFIKLLLILFSITT